ncbi:hypothetical protein NPIL_426911 [Nephila pilipes]|uniref:Uncharacterized protein n=1 Tax=Nephila pilipes TaxID=299642 RepID=A0A8X6UVJ9_NEPPI|nr:hypothetical protein NPIL_426911 [Nephila pilipes]
MSDKERVIREGNFDLGSKMSLKDSGRDESSLSDFSRDQETDILDDLTQVRNFCKIDISNPRSKTIPFHCESRRSYEY